MVDSPDFLILGLGNPGRDYEATRHNFGFLVVDALARARGQTLREGPGPSRICPYEAGGHRGWLAEPLTYMNRSGIAARALLDAWSGPDIERVLVATDDLDLPLGRIRFRRGGGHGGHNGLRSLIGELGVSDFPRLRLGIGRPPAGARTDVIDWVLDGFEDPEQDEVQEVLVRAQEGVRMFITDGIEAVMNHFNAG